MMFTKDNNIEGMILRPPVKEVKPEIITRILKDAGIKSNVVNIGKPRTWIMQSQRIWTDDGRCFTLKIGVNSDWTDGSTIISQVKASELIRSVGIPQPEIKIYSSNIDDYGMMFILSESYKGERLCDQYLVSTKNERERLYKNVGQAYSALHSIQNDWAGIWDGNPKEKKYPVHPAEFYMYAEICNGSAKFLVEQNVISRVIYENICSVWDSNLQYLKKRPNSLVHISPFPWSIYISKMEGKYLVEGFAALGDFMWWDSMLDIAHLLYPPFLNISKEEQNAFISEYTFSIDEQAVNLYTLLNRVCAMSGCYLAPVEEEHNRLWTKQEIKTIETILRKLM